MRNIAIAATPSTPAAAPGPVHFQGMWTQDAGTKEVFRIIEKVAAEDVTVLVRGETGAGKELVAQAIHALSPRKSGPFRAINCAALPPTLLESELFGHVRGAFTGAVRDVPGHFQLAHRGTLFLDEIAELPLELQAKMLRVLETGTVIPVGARDPVSVDVRVVSATHRALRKEAEAGRFRADLMYRLRVIPIFLPPLRLRPGDPSLLTRIFVDELNKKNRRTIEDIAPETLRVLEAHDWPGNIRELRNVLAYAYVIGEGPVLRPCDLPPEVLGEDPAERCAALHPRPPREPQAPPLLTAAGPLTPSRPLEPGPVQPSAKTSDDETTRILAALETSHGKRHEAAAALGMSRITLWRRMKALGLEAEG